VAGKAASAGTVGRLSSLFRTFTCSCATEFPLWWLLLSSFLFLVVGAVMNDGAVCGGSAV